MNLYFFTFDSVDIEVGSDYSFLIKGISKFKVTDGEVLCSVAGGFKNKAVNLQLAMEGTWKNAFGLSFLTISDVYFEIGFPFSKKKKNYFL